MNDLCLIVFANISSDSLYIYLYIYIRTCSVSSAASQLQFEFNSAGGDDETIRYNRATSMHAARDR